MTAKALRKLILLSGQPRLPGDWFVYPLWDLYVLQHSNGAWYVFTPAQLYGTPEEAIFAAVRGRYGV